MNLFRKKHEHTWKAVRFEETTKTSVFGTYTGTDVGWECQGCPERRFTFTHSKEADARWLARAEEVVPDAFVKAFDGDER